MLRRWRWLKQRWIPPAVRPLPDNESRENDTTEKSSYLASKRRTPRNNEDSKRSQWGQRLVNPTAQDTSKYAYKKIICGFSRFSRNWRAIFLYQRVVKVHVHPNFRPWLFWSVLRRFTSPPCGARNSMCFLGYH